jgi:hypothetical protein
VLFPASPIPAPISFIVSLPPECPQVGNRLIGHDYHIATLAAVTAVGAAEGNKLLVAEADRSAAAVTSLDHYLRPVKHGYYALSTILSTFAAY